MEGSFVTSFAPPSSPTALGAGSPLKFDRWFGVFEKGDPIAYRYLLLMRYAMVNAVALALVAAAWFQGWIELVLASDATRLVLVILLVFAAGLGLATMKVVQTGAELNQIRAARRDPASRAAQYLQAIGGRDGHSRAITASALKLKLGGRIAVIRHIANTLVFLGLIGTVIGFMIALSGVDPESAADIGAIGPMVSTLISGMSVALSTTLAGAILNVWLMVNYRILESGTLRLLTAIVELGEQHVQS
jgi:biopolymer transport protein ExbB/TolQ